jgi:hypothetical protein
MGLANQALFVSATFSTGQRAAFVDGHAFLHQER